MVNLLSSLGTNVPLGVLIGAGVTAVIQSSSAMTALVIAMGSAGVLPLPAAIALVLGANIGTTVTAQIASVGASLAARQLARAQLLVNAIGVAVFIPLVPWYATLMAQTSPLLARQIANAHTLFNVASTLAFLPLTGGLAWLAGRITRGQPPVVSTGPVHLAEAFLAAPAVALSQAQHKRLPTDALSTRDERRLHVLDHATGDIERVGDQAVNIAERGRVILAKGYPLSAPARADLQTMFDKATALYREAVEALRDEDQDKAQEALRLEAEVDRLEKHFKEAHFRRVDEGICQAEAGALYLEILHNLERIGDHAVNIAGDVLYAL